MIKTLLAQVKEFKKASFLTPVFMILEVVVETLIPLVMADMIDHGVEAGNISYLYQRGAIMALLAVAGLITGVLGGKYGAYASSGFARNLRKAMYTNIQTYSFSNIDKFSTASLITRLTTDVTNLQNAYQMILRMCTRAPASLICAMAMAFMINARIASIYLIAVIFLGCFLVFIMRKATKYFREVFEKYDDLNASVQENINAVRVVKAYVREDYVTLVTCTPYAVNTHRLLVRGRRVEYTGEEKSKTVSQLQPAAMARRLVDVWPWFLFMMAGGHVLIEDIPGVGKTSMALAFARAMNLTQNRVQFTPDVLPSDITGISMYIKEKDTFVYQPGAVMCNLFLADEINRTSAKTQSAFLEVMEEGTVTVDGVTRQVLDPFVVIATENPIGSAGTQMLPEPQLDRFLICIQMGYPSNADDSMADYLQKNCPSVPDEAISHLQALILNASYGFREVTKEDVQWLKAIFKQIKP